MKTEAATIYGGGSSHEDGKYFIFDDNQMKSNKENWTHNTVIDAEMVGKCYSVYTGSRFVPVTPRKRDIGKTLLSLATSN